MHPSRQFAPEIGIAVIAKPKVTMVIIAVKAAEYKPTRFVFSKANSELGM
jgi:hypothetical protein